MRETVIKPFVEGARVRADVLQALADAIGGEQLGHRVRIVPTRNPPPATAEGRDVAPALMGTYAAHERAALIIAENLDGTI